MPRRRSGPGKTAPPETGEGLEYQRKSWRAQRIGWVLMGLFITLGILGLFGDGPLTRARVGSPDRFQARYYRVWRLQTEARVDLTSLPDSSGQVTLRVEESLLDRAEIRFVSPEPRRIEAVPGGQQIVFDAKSDGPVSLQVGITPSRIGRFRTRLATANSPPLTLSVLVLP